MNAITDIRTTIRASSLPMFADCPRRWAARHIGAEIADAGYQLREVPVGIGAAIGTSVHAGAGQILQHRIDTGRLPADPRDAADAAVAELDALTADGVVWDGATGGLNDAHAQVPRMVRAFWAGAAPKLDPVEVEQRIEAPHPDNPLVVISGQGDVFEADGVGDLKTGTMQRANAAQYGTYSLLRRSQGGTVNRITEIFLPRVAAKKDQPMPELHEIPVEAAEQASWATINQIVRVLGEFRDTGNAWAWLPNPQSVLCGDKWCPAWGTEFCRVHRGAI